LPRPRRTGKPVAFYSDKHRIFQNVRYAPRADFPESALCAIFVFAQYRDDTPVQS
jgi:hypothetical protein